MKLERLISIIYKLLNHEVLSASVLAEEYDVSPRTIYRDIDAICAAGFPVVSYQGTNGGYGIMNGYKMDRALLGTYDVNSLIAVLRGLASVFEDGRAQGTIERLQAIGPERLDPSLSIDLDTRRTDPEALPLLRAAIAERAIVRFDYVNVRNERAERELEPLRLQFKYGNWYVYGYCRARREHREFRLSRMISLEQTKNVFEPRPQMPELPVAPSVTGMTVEKKGPEVPGESKAPEAPDTPNGPALSYRERQEPLEDVVIRVMPEALADAMDHFQLADKQFHADGSVTMRIPVHRPLSARWLRSILLGFGGGAEVLEPPGLREILREQLQTTLKLYSEV